MRSSRNEPPRFGNDNLDDDLVARGSPLPPDYGQEMGFDGGMDFYDDLPMDLEEPDEAIREPEALLMEKQDAIMESIRKIVPQYWDILDDHPLSHTRITERCFVVQDLNDKTLSLKVYLRSFFIAHV